MSTLSGTPAIRLLGALDCNFAWDGVRLYDEAAFRAGLKPPFELRGAAASVQYEASGACRLLRDPLGINKLFWARGAHGEIVMAARPRRLVDAGVSFEDIRALPRGCVVDLGPAAASPVQHSIVPPAWFSATGAGGIEETGRTIRDVLDRYMDAIAAAYPNAPVFACLSGGLDSTGIAALAARHFDDVTAVSFDLVRPGGRASEDRLTARRLARDLRLRLLEATVSEDELFAKLDTVLIEGVDWRDFNVHAGLVNASLADAIARAAPQTGNAKSVIVLTGDFANEFLVDYHAQRYKGNDYYQLPRLSPRTLRATLVQGLDTCHREVGVFAAWNLAVVQPYAAAADAYLALPDSFLALDDRKQRLCRAVFGALIPDYVYARPKARAQVGGADVSGGVLAACVERRFDGAWLRRRYAALHAVTDLSVLERFMRAGRYRAEIPAPGAEAA